jgi:HEAT repeat protein
MNLDVSERERESILQDLASSDEEVRRLGVERLAALPSAEAVPRLVECLGDSGWRVRKAAVERLVACSESDRVCDALIAALADGENPGRRNAAVEALVGCGSRVLPRLVEALSSDDVDVRKLLVDAVAGIADGSARDAMLHTLRDPDANVRAAAADALGVLDGAEVPGALLRTAVSPSEDALVRYSALRSLARLEVRVRARDLAPALGDPTLRPAALVLLGSPEDEEALQRLSKAVASGSRASREAAMQAFLQMLGEAEAERAQRIAARIREAARQSQDLVADTAERLAEADLSARLVLIQFLGVVGEAACVIPILRAGRDEALAEVARSTLESLGETAEAAIDAAWADLDVELRRDACRILECTRGERGLARLVAALDESDAQVRSAAARAIGRRGEARALPRLVLRLEAAAAEQDLEADEELAAITDALVEISGERSGAAAGEVIELLSAQLEGANEVVRLAIATVLGRVGRHEDAELVTFLLKDPSEKVRRAAVDALAHLEPGAASEPLRLALADEAAGVRIAAAAALGMSENPGVLDDVPRLLGDEDPRVRAAAVRAMGAHCARAGDGRPGSRAFALIRGALSDGGEVALAAVEALAAVGGVEAGRVACELLGRSEPELVQAAVRCVGEHGDAGALQELLRLVAHPDWAVRAEVIQALAERGVAKAVPPILRRLETEQDSFVRDAILRALKRLER